jgi:NAD-dependent DNA ligase
MTKMFLNLKNKMPKKSTIQNQTFLFTGTLTEFTRDEAPKKMAG